MRPIIGNSIQRRLLCDSTTQSTSLSAHPATPVLKAHCRGKGIEEAASAAFTCRQRLPHVSSHAEGIDNAETEHLPSTASYNNWSGMFKDTAFGVTVNTIRMPRYVHTARQIDLGRLVLETDSPMLSRASGHP